MGVLSRTSAPTPALDQTLFGLRIILGKVRSLASPRRDPSTGSDHCSVENCIHQNYVLRARVQGRALQPSLLSWWANTVGGQWCERHGRQGVNLASINLRRIRKMPVPPRYEQQLLEEELSERLTAARRQLLQDIRDARVRQGALRRGLLTAAFSSGL